MREPELEAIDRSALAALQLERLRATLARVGENPAWRRRLAGARPEDLRHVDDWRRLPLLTKTELRDAYPYGLACGGAEGYRRVHMSSGTTGNPILNPYTAADVEQWGEVMARCYVAAGVTRDDVIQITPSFGLFTGGFGFHYGAERLGAMVVPVGAGRTVLQLKLMRDLGVTVLPGIATYPLRLLEVARAERFDLGSLTLRVAILGSEMWSDELRARIDRELNVTSYDIIGMTETGGPGLGIDCAARAGIHVWEDHYLVEIVDPRTGAGLADGVEGELVVSTLTRQGLPLVRYRTHDLTRVVSRARCACGRTMLRLDRLRGRSDDMVIYKGVNFYPRQIEALLLRTPGLGPEYQIVLDSDGGGERLTIVAEAEAGVGGDDAARLERALHDLLALSPVIQLCPAGTIERAPGKSVRVVDRRARA
ncbi:MAG TPA: phenylacetate--CoA ligase [Methylomirabilota bacterium]|jgi:phenylacetate-CoA ligase|nr:phenylacetate--CoA ligase [Methylomirabilota bacterium]